MTILEKNLQLFPDPPVRSCESGKAPFPENSKTTMKTKLTSIVVALATFGIANAEPPKGAEKGKGKARAERPELTEEQKAARKKAMEERKAKFEAMTDEEKAALKAEMEKRRAAWEALTQDERKAKMEQMRALYKKHAGDREALAKDEEFIKLRAEMPPRGGARGGRPARGKAGAEGRSKGREGAKKGPKKQKKPASE